MNDEVEVLLLQLVEISKESYGDDNIQTLITVRYNTIIIIIIIKTMKVISACFHYFYYKIMLFKVILYLYLYYSTCT